MPTSISECANSWPTVLPESLLSAQRHSHAHSSCSLPLWGHFSLHVWPRKGLWLRSLLHHGRPWSYRSTSHFLQIFRDHYTFTYSTCLIRNMQYNMTTVGYSWELSTHHVARRALHIKYCYCPRLQMEKLRLRTVKWLDEGQTASKR